MALRKLLFTTFLLALGVSVQGRGSGAPESKDTCETLTPKHGGIEPQTGASPYGIQQSSESVKGGEQVTITIVSQPGGDTLKGFMLQGRKSGNDVTPVGYFIPGGDQQGLKCFAGPNSTLTHTNNRERKSVSSIWVAPSEPGKYVIWATAVKDGGTFWVGLQSKVITVT